MTDKERGYSFAFDFQMSVVVLPRSGWKSWPWKVRCMAKEAVFRVAPRLWWRYFS